MKPRPVFGQPETGRVRHWFRTDAQMRRNYMDPEAREQERERISQRRTLMKKMRAESAEVMRRASHVHFFCDTCAGGLHDVGVIEGKTKKTQRESDPTRVCCVCLTVVALGPKRRTVASEWGPNRALLRCLVLDPVPAADPVDEEAVAW